MLVRIPPTYVHVNVRVNILVHVSLHCTVHLQVQYDIIVKVYQVRVFQFLIFPIEAISFFKGSQTLT